jgi:multidrug efflux pump subunit AcrA (membrane-fusion protein)
MNDEIVKKEEPEKSIESDETSSSENEEFTDENTESDEISPRRKSLIGGGIVAACLLLIVGYFYFERNKSAETAADSTTGTKEEVVVSVKVAQAEKQPISNEYRAIGTVAPAEQSTVAASISAQISQMRLLKNQYVKQGEVLAVLASNDLQAQRSEANAALEEAKLNLQTLQKVTIPQTAAQNQKDAADAKANADNARAVYERRKDLYAKGGLSLKELEASGLALKNAENALRLTEQNAKLNASAVNPNARAIAESKIKQAQTRVNTIDVQNNLAEVRAPISGIVTDQFQFQGEYAAAGARLLTISDTGAVIVKANFADTVVANLHTGDAVSIFLPSAPDERMGGKITQISRSADTQNRTVEVWANFGNGRGLLRAGDAVQFVVAANPTDGALVVPVSAVTLETSNADEGTVMAVDKDDIAHETKVKVGIKSGGLIQIVEGLEEGATVIIEGNYALPDGTKVEVQKETGEGEN